MIIFINSLPRGNDVSSQRFRQKRNGENGAERVMKDFFSNIMRVLLLGIIYGFPILVLLGVSQI